MISTYKRVQADTFSFTSVKKEENVYYIRPEQKLFIQTPCIAITDSLTQDDGQLVSQISLQVPSRFVAWVKGMENAILKYALDNKSSLFSKDLEDEFIKGAMKSTISGGSWKVSVHPDMHVFDQKKNIVPATEASASAKVVTLFVLHSVRFTKKSFYCKWVLRSLRLMDAPVYQFIDEEVDDYSPTQSSISDDEESIPSESYVNEHNENGKIKTAEDENDAHDSMNSSEVVVPVAVEELVQQETVTESPEHIDQIVMEASEENGDVVGDDEDLTQYQFIPEQEDQDQLNLKTSAELAEPSNDQEDDKEQHISDDQNEDKEITEVQKVKGTEHDNNKLTSPEEVSSESNEDSDEFVKVIKVRQH